MDHLSPQDRSRNMAAIKSKDTKPELAVRATLHRLGLRYRLHKKNLPGKPDLVFPRYKTALFVHGCFWHGHAKCFRIPKSNKKYWGPKIRINMARDRRHEKNLKKDGWRVLKLWACQINKASLLTMKKKITGKFYVGLK